MFCEEIERFELRGFLLWGEAIRYSVRVVRGGGGRGGGRGK